MVDLFKQYEKLLLQDRSILEGKGLFLDLTTIPAKYKDAFIQWVVIINKDRIAKDQSIVMNLELALKCPVWKLIRPPIVSINLTKESFNKTKKPIKTFNTVQTVKSINSK